MLLQGNAPTNREPTSIICGLFDGLQSNYSVYTPPQMYFSTPWPVIVQHYIVVYLKVSKVYSCNIYLRNKETQQTNI